MVKKLVILFACFGLAFQVTSCTSKNNQSDADIAADLEAADLERLEGDDALDLMADDSLFSDSLPEDALGEMPADSLADSSSQFEMSDLGDPLPADPFAETTEAIPSFEESTPTYAETTEPSYTTESFTSSEPEYTTAETSYNEPAEAVEPEPAPRVNIPLQKVPDDPWMVGGKWYNSVYFAQPGDTLESISMRVYGEDRTDELGRANPTYTRREVRPGDKVYYNSPNRSGDNSRILTFYEDNGLVPEVYVAQEGDNIRSVAKDLLGYEGAWKEVWSSNTVDSKGALTAGTELRYWRNAGAVTAQNTQAQQPQQQSQEQPMDSYNIPEERQEVVGSTPPPPMEEPYQDPYMDDYSQQAQGEMPSPPMPAEVDHGLSGDMVPPPPPPPTDYAYENEMVPPPPPPVEAINPPQPTQQIAEDTGSGMDNDSTMVLGIVGIAAAGLAALVVIRKKRKQRELEQQALDETHVGT